MERHQFMALMSMFQEFRLSSFNVDVKSFDTESVFKMLFNISAGVKSLASDKNVEYSRTRHFNFISLRAVVSLISRIESNLI